tara:strand:- start:3734 stop:3970 length:237 start_codon:yes stop_codon:yes gene_type:complete
MNQQLLTIGILVILIGFVMVFIGALSGTQKSETKVAVGGFIGFIPFGFANDSKLLYALMGIMSFFLLVWLLYQSKIFS